eukprot:799559_1
MDLTAVELAGIQMNLRETTSPARKSATAPGAVRGSTTRPIRVVSMRCARCQIRASSKVRSRSSSLERLTSSTHSQSSSVAAQPLLVSSDLNLQRCDNCWRDIPRATFQMHALQCVRRVWRCPDCGQVIQRTKADTHAHCPKCSEIMPKSEIEKHIELTHSLATCDCGESMEQRLLQEHKEQDCNMRRMECRFCSMHVPERELDAHQLHCGARTFDCEICKKIIPQSKMKIHMATVHGVNPSLSEQNPQSSALNTFGPDSDLAKALAESERSYQQEQSDQISSISAADEKSSGSADEKAGGPADELSEHSPVADEDFADGDFLSDDEFYSDEDEAFSDEADAKTSGVRGGGDRLIMGGGKATGGSMVGFHGFPCPVCNKQIPLSVNLNDHISSCS